jgi:hypothetical protein
LHLEPLEQRYVLTNSLVVVPSPPVTEGFLLGTAALAANDIWAVGYINSPAVQTLAEHFDGNSWQVVPTPSPGNLSRLRSVAAVASNDVWAVGQDITPNGFDHPLIEHWDGSSWTIIDGSPLAKSLYGVTAIASNDVWAVGGLGVGFQATVEHWDGSSWSLVSSPAFVGSQGLASVSADASNDVWAVSRVNGPQVVHFDGTNWTRINPHSLTDFNSVTALSPTDVWAVGSFLFDYDDVRPEIEHWDGSQWQLVPSPDPRPGGQGGSELTGVAAISPTDIWAVGAVGAFGNLQTLTEHWDGTSWSIIPSPNPGNRSSLIGVTALSDGTVAAVGYQPDVNPSQRTPLILQNRESAPPGSGPAVPAAPLFLHASADPRLSLAGLSTVSNVAVLDTSLMQDQLNPRSVDPIFATGKPDPALRLARDQSLAQQGPEDDMGRTDAIDRLFTEWI